MTNISKKIKTFLINDTEVIYCIRVNDNSLLIVHENPNLKNEMLSDQEFETRYKVKYE